MFYWSWGKTRGVYYIECYKKYAEIAEIAGGYLGYLLG